MNTKSITVQDLITDDDWEVWHFAKEQSPQALLDELEAADGDGLAARLTPTRVIRYGLWTGERLAGKVKYSQLRNFVDEIKRIYQGPSDEASVGLIRTDLVLFQIQLLHGLSRQAALDPFVTLLRGIIQRNETWLRSRADLDRFMALVDSITAHFEVLRPPKNDQDD
jgi:hypothetical protein